MLLPRATQAGLATVPPATPMGVLISLRLTLRLDQLAVVSVEAARPVQPTVAQLEPGARFNSEAATRVMASHGTFRVVPLRIVVLLAPGPLPLGAVLAPVLIPPWHARIGGQVAREAVREG
eukprot:3604628-Pyramimonas_sp.AAC.1